MCPVDQGAKVDDRHRSEHRIEGVHRCTSRKEDIMNFEVTDRTPRRTIAITDNYKDAEAIVNRLADEGFPVRHASIVGRDLQYVERVVGQLNGWKAALSGALSGLMMGLLFGLLFGIWFAHDGTSLLAIVIYWAGFGALVGAAISLFGYALSGGRRNFASVADVQPQRFAVLVDESFADDAVRRLSGALRAPHHAH
jgi:hypothetical protein